MKRTNSLDQFIGLYPLSKTLRFELKPIGTTLDHIIKGGLLNEDENRADNYKAIKKLIDEYHKTFIETSLNGLCLDSEALDTCADMYGKMDEPLRARFDKAQEILRKQIAKSFDTKRLFGKELIKEDLPKFLEKEDQRRIVDEFSNFTTYFTGFNDNRRNMYTDELKATAISYRLVNENLPKFIGNMKVFAFVKEALGTNIEELRNDFEPYLNGLSIEDVFTNIQNYSLFLCQKDITLYNALLGGKTGDGVKIKGLNEYINLYNQQNKTRLPKFVMLYKQILSDRESLSWQQGQFSNDSELLASVENFYQELHSLVFDGNEDIISLKSLLASIRDYDLGGIYIKNDADLTGVIRDCYGDWSLLTRAMEEKYDCMFPCKEPKAMEKHLIKREKYIRSFKSLSLLDIDLYLGERREIENYFELLGAEDGQPSLFEILEARYAAVKDLLNTEPSGKLSQNDTAIEGIKDLLDSIKAIQHFIRPLAGTGTEGGRDGRFYSDYEGIWSVVDKITPLYNMVRNYLTRKPYSEEKFKLNFDNSTLLNGWDVNKERDNSGVILRKDGLYYLAIMDKKSNKVFDMQKFPDDGECYEKMDYKLLPGPNKMLPKVFFSKSRIDEFAPDAMLLENYEKGTHKKGPDFNIEHCHELIDFFKRSINKHEDWKNFGFNFSDTSSYSDLSGFYREVEQQGYKMSFRKISSAYIDSLVEEGKIYLFQIYNKDFSQYSKGTPNLHTMYWRALFSDENLKDIVYKLNGEAEVFYRKKSLEYSEEKMSRGFHHETLKDKFSYPIIKDRRYAFDKFQFHVPITMNFKSYGIDNIDQQVRGFIKNGEIEHIIGIDRGERNLLYLSMIDMDGRIVKQQSLNQIINEHNGKVHAINYHNILDSKESDRLTARRTWKTIENIKDIKEGYLSQVVHIISQMMVEYKAIVVLEDLNMGFMRGRQKVEKQVYQKFEKLLIDKLNYLVDKHAPAGECGSVMKAYQLTSKFDSFQKLGKQSGFLFYVPAWNTSKIDPVTGFANFISTKYENIEKSRNLFGKFADIKYNPDKHYFEFLIDNYSSFNPKLEGTRQVWTICTYGDRIRTFRNAEKNNEWDNETVDVTAKMKMLFEKFGIVYTSNLLASILIQDKKEFFEELLYLLGLTLQMRNSRTGTEEDYMISPVADRYGVFYDSRNCSGDNASLPKDADANGAYNIARKGLWAIYQIQKAENLGKVSLAISNSDWLRFVQSR